MNKTAAGLFSILLGIAAPNARAAAEAQGSAPRPRLRFRGTT
jgi:hypothetical protein